MRSPTLDDLPPSPPGKIGWPWTKESSQLPETMLSGQSWSCISIVTPSYNHGQFIEETIRSVLLQGYPNLEYIVIDGGSTDETVQIIKKYTRWLKYWVSEPDRGQSHAINKGLKRCSGEIFNWINSDDLLVPGALKAIAMAWREKPQAIIAGRVINFDEEGAENLISPNALSLENFINIRKARENGMRWHQPGTFLPRASVSSVGGVQEDLKFCMDHILMIDLLQKHEIVYIPEILARFRLHESSKTLTFGFLQFKLERVKKLRTMKDLGSYITTKELKQEQISVLMTYADLERRKTQYISSYKCYVEAFNTSPFLTTISLLRRGVIGRIIRFVKRKLNSNREKISLGL